MSASRPPLVSVIVPAFNHEALIGECLESVADQTYRDVELLVLDDGSRDGTVAAAERTIGRPGFAKRFARVELVRNERNLGAHETLNRGVSMARGELCAVLNSDDRYGRERLSALVDALQSSGAEIAFSAVRMIDTAGRDITEEDWFATQLSHTQRSIRAWPSVGWASLRQNVALSTGNLFFRRGLAQRIGPFRALRYCHDWDFLLRAVLVTEPLFLPAPLYDYRIHESNSFRSLANVANVESAYVLRAYFARIRARSFKNPLAPGPETWPGVFESLMEMMGFWGHWQLARRCDPPDAAG